MKQPPTAGLIIGLCLGIGFLIVFLLMLLYCCFHANDEEDEEREGWRRLGLIPAAELRKPPNVVSSSLSTADMPYKTMDDKSTPHLMNKDTFLYK